MPRNARPVRARLRSIAFGLIAITIATVGLVRSHANGERQIGVPALFRLRTIALGLIAIVGVAVGLAHATAHTRMTLLDQNMQTAASVHPWLKAYHKFLHDELERKTHPTSTTYKALVDPFVILLWQTGKSEEIYGFPDQVGVAYIRFLRSQLDKTGRPDAEGHLGFAAHVARQNELLLICRSWPKGTTDSNCDGISDYIGSFWKTWLTSDGSRRSFHADKYLTSEGGALRIRDKLSYFAEVCNFTPYAIVAQFTKEHTGVHNEAAERILEASGQVKILPGSCKPVFDQKDLPQLGGYIAAWPGDDTTFRNLAAQNWHSAMWQGQLGWAPNDTGPVLCADRSYSRQHGWEESCYPATETRYFGQALFNNERRYVFYVVDQAVCQQRGDPDCQNLSSEQLYGGLQGWARDLSVSLVVRKWFEENLGGSDKCPYRLGVAVDGTSSKFDRGLTIQSVEAHPFGLNSAVTNGDRLVSVAGVPIFAFEDLVGAIAAFGRENGMLKPIPIEFERGGAVYDAEAGLFFNPDFWGKECPTHLGAAWSGMWNGITLGMGLDIAFSCGWKAGSVKEAERRSMIETCKKTEEEERWRLRQFCGFSYSAGEFLSLLETAGGTLLLRGLARSTGKSLVGKMARGRLVAGVVTGLEGLIIAYNSAPPGQSRVMTMDEVLRSAGIGGAIGILMGPSLRRPILRK